ncbi:MAG: hypothetical protein ABEJ56_04320 [Candidatus Nanohaloarchaea archaeon]
MNTDIQFSSVNPEESLDQFKDDLDEIDTAKLEVEPEENTEVPDVEIFYDGSNIIVNPYDSDHTLDFDNLPRTTGINIWDQDQTGRVLLEDRKEFHEYLFSAIKSPIRSNVEYQEPEGNTLGDFSDANRILYSTEEDISKLETARKAIEELDLIIETDTEDYGGGPALEAKYIDGRVIVGPINDTLETGVFENQVVEVDGEEIEVEVEPDYQTADTAKYGNKLPTLPDN